MEIHRYFVYFVVAVLALFEFTNCMGDECKICETGGKLGAAC